MSAWRAVSPTYGVCMCYPWTIIIATDVIASSYPSLRPRPILQHSSTIQWVLSAVWSPQWVLSMTGFQLRAEISFAWTFSLDSLIRFTENCHTFILTIFYETVYMARYSMKLATSTVMIILRSAAESETRGYHRVWIGKLNSTSYVLKYVVSQVAQVRAPPRHRRRYTCTWESPGEKRSEVKLKDLISRWCLKRLAITCSDVHSRYWSEIILLIYMWVKFREPLNGQERVRTCRSWHVDFDSGYVCASGPEI